MTRTDTSRAWLGVAATVVLALGPACSESTTRSPTDAGDASGDLRGGDTARPPEDDAASPDANTADAESTDMSLDDTGPSPDAAPATPQPVAPQARPGGGQWALVFQDEFDGTGGTAEGAMSGPQWAGKTVGGGSLPGNPGLNPRKWNVGWWTGPATLAGHGNVQKATYWHNNNEGQWWALEAIQFPGDGTLTMQAHQRAFPGGAPQADTPAWTKTQNAYGMISTAGLFAINPASLPTGNIPAGRYCNGPSMLEWREQGTFVVDWPANWTAPWGNFPGAGSSYPSGTSYVAEIDLVEPVFRLHAASEAGPLAVIPAGADKNGWITWTWYFDATRIICWCTPEGQPTQKMFDTTDGVAAQFQASGHYFMFAQQTKQFGAGPFGDTKYDYVRIWN